MLSRKATSSFHHRHGTRFHQKLSNLSSGCWTRIPIVVPPRQKLCKILGSPTNTSIPFKNCGTVPFCPSSLPRQNPLNSPRLILPIRKIKRPFRERWFDRNHGGTFITAAMAMVDSPTASNRICEERTTRSTFMPSKIVMKHNPFTFRVVWLVLSIHSCPNFPKSQIVPLRWKLRGEEVRRVPFFGVLPPQDSLVWTVFPRDTNGTAE